MSKKSKKKPKKKDRVKAHKVFESQSEISVLLKKIKKLEKELNKRERLIEQLNSRLKQDKASKAKPDKPAKRVPNPLFRGQNKRVGVTQRKAWQRHGYLRDRYEFHLAKTQDKGRARVLADKDLRERYGEDAGYTEQELEQILS